MHCLKNNKRMNARNTKLFNAGNGEEEHVTGFEMNINFILHTSSTLFFLFSIL
jgi:hypothetical protein